MTLAQKIFETAEDDLNSVTVLYNSKHYNLALFQLQQAVEKFVKSYGLQTEVINPLDLVKKISHLPHKVFIRQYSKQIEELSNRRETPIFIPEMVPPHQRGKSKIKEKIEGLKRLQSKIVESANPEENKDITCEEIEQFLAQARELEKEQIFDEEKLFNDFKDDFIKTNEHFKEYFSGVGNEFILEDINESLENPDVYVRNQILNYKYDLRRREKFTYISFVWVNLSLITAPHEQSTRYPSTESDETPSEYYRLENAMVKYIPEFVKLMKYTIDKYNEIFKIESLRTTSVTLNPGFGGSLTGN